MESRRVKLSKMFPLVLQKYVRFNLQQAVWNRAPSRSRKPLRLAEDFLRLASRQAAAYGGLGAILWYREAYEL